MGKPILPASLAYRCRLCGSLFHSIHVSDGHYAFDLFEEGDQPYWAPNPTEPHDCSQAMRGIGDFAGVLFDGIRPGVNHGPTEEAHQPEDP